MSLHFTPHRYEVITPISIDLFEEFVDWGKSVPFVLGADGRWFQSEAFKVFRGKHRTVLIAPTGSGKSLIHIFGAVDEVRLSNYELKVLIALPQRNIARSFCTNGHVRLLLDGEEWIWEVGLNACHDSIGDEVVRQVRGFLLSKPNNEADKANRTVRANVAVVTYAAVLAALHQMTPEEKRIAITTTSLYVDEAHHLANVDQWEKAATELGELVREWLRYEGSRVHLGTATFFRGDNKSILSREFLKSFTKYRVEFMDHWKTLGLNKFIQDYKCYSDAEDAKNQILEAIRAEPDKPVLIILPRSGEGIFKWTEKTQFVKSFVAEVKTILEPKMVLNLISKDRQDADEEIITYGDQSDISAVVTCYKGREGMDWPACARIHNLQLDGNVLQVIQKLGRALRRFPGKTDVIMFNYIEYFAGWKTDSEKFRQTISERFTSVAVMSMLDDMFYPILMPKIPGGCTIGKKRTRKEWVTLEDVYGDKRQNIIMDLAQKAESLPNDSGMSARIDRILQEIINKYREDMLTEVDDYVLMERLRKELIRRFNPRIPRLRLDDNLTNLLSRVSWDQVVRKYIAPRSFFEGTASTEDIERLQKELWALDPDLIWKEMCQKIAEIGIPNLKKGSEEDKWFNGAMAAWARDYKEKRR